MKDKIKELKALRATLDQGHAAYNNLVEDIIEDFKFIGEYIILDTGSCEVTEDNVSILITPIKPVKYEEIPEFIDELKQIIAKYELLNG